MKKIVFTTFTMFCVLSLTSILSVNCSPNSKAEVNTPAFSTTSIPSDATLTLTSSSPKSPSLGYIRDSDIQYGYNLEYPETWSLDVVVDPALLDSVRSGIVKKEVFTNKEDGTNISVKVRIANWYTYEDHIFKQYTRNYHYYDITIKEGNIDVNGRTWYEVVYKSAPVNPIKITREISIDIENWRYFLEYSASTEASFVASEAIFNNVLNSFNIN